MSPTTLRRASLAAALGCALALGACAGPATVGAGLDHEDLEGDWRLTEGTGPAGDIELIEGHDVTLSIDGDEWGGTAACNTYGASATLDGDSVEITELLRTEMACTEEGVMEAENAYLEALQAVSTVERDGSTLVLRGEEAELVFAEVAPEPDTALGGTS